MNFKVLVKAELLLMKSDCCFT